MIPLQIMVAGDQEDEAAGLPRAALVASQWAFDAESLRTWRYSANFVYTMTINGERQYLRVAPASERTPERLAQEVALLDWLQAQGWHVPVAIPTRAGDRIATATTSDGSYHAVMWSEVPGRLRELDDLSTADLAAWGAALGRLHSTLQQAPQTARPNRTAWHAERDLILAALPTWPPAVQAAATQSLGWITTLPTSGDEYGLIHGDFELDNLPWGDDGPGIIDFDEAGESWLTADIAFAVRDLIEEGEDVSSPRLAAFLAGYATAQPLAAGLPEKLPRFSQWARLATLARIAHACPDDDSQLPEWARALNQRLGDLAATYQMSVLNAAAVLSA